MSYYSWMIEDDEPRCSCDYNAPDYDFHTDGQTCIVGEVNKVSGWYDLPMASWYWNELRGQ